jgi:hypothetical protein
MMSLFKSRTQPARDPSAAFAQAMTAQVRQAVLDAIVHAGRAGPAALPALTVERASVPVAPARLAAAHPGDAAAREGARQLYESCLSHYRNAVRAQDQPGGVDDVGAAVAAFVAANFSALRGMPVTQPMLRALERQLHGIACVTSDWEAAPLVERQAYFEQMALLAVLVADSAAQASSQGAAAVANVQRAARGYLRQLLDLDPDELTLGPDGLAARAS